MPMCMSTAHFWGAAFSYNKFLHRMASRVRHSCKFSHRMALARCPSRTKPAPNFWGGMFPVNSRIEWLFKDAHLQFDWARSHILCVAILGRGTFPVNSRIKLPLWHVHVRFDSAGRRPAQSCASQPWGAEIFFEILARNGSCDMSMCVSIAQARTNCASQSWGAAFFL